MRWGDRGKVGTGPCVRRSAAEAQHYMQLLSVLQLTPWKGLLNSIMYRSLGLAQWLVTAWKQDIAALPGLCLVSTALAAAPQVFCKEMQQPYVAVCTKQAQLITLKACMRRRTVWSVMLIPSLAPKQQTAAAPG